MGGSLRHGDPGVRLIEASETGLDFFTTVPASFQARMATGVLRRTTICSVATSCPSVHRSSRPACRSRTSSSTRRMPEAGVNAGANIAFSYDGQTISLPLIISEGLTAGQVGLPMGMPGIAPVLAGARLDNLQEAKA
ncbi:hypothetical protein ACP3P6_09865 [Enterobacter mori]